MTKHRLGTLARRLILVFIATVLATVTTAAEPLAGTQPLTAEGDLAAQMVEGIDRFLLRKTDESIAARARHWHRDTSSVENYSESIKPNRERLKRIIGAGNPRSLLDRSRAFCVTHTIGSTRSAAPSEVTAEQVTWPAFRAEDGPTVAGEGLLINPAGRKPVVNLIAIPDADTTEWDFARTEFVRRLARSGCRVLIPTLINRSQELSLVGGERRTNQPHREFIYRQTFEMGRHLIGYEVDRVLAAIDIFESPERPDADLPIGVIGYGEGGLLAFYAAAVDPRIDVALVSGYFDSRQDLWQEPIYRNVWSLLDEFGDAEIASLIAPRPLIIEAAAAPKVDGPPKPIDGRGGAAPGRLVTPTLDAVRKEAARARSLVEGLNPAPVIEVIASGDGSGPPGCDAALARFVNALVPVAPLADAGRPLAPTVWPDEAQVQARQFHQLVEYTQHLMREGEYRRREFWQEADPKSLDTWRSSTIPYRDYFANEVIGRFEEQPLPPNARTRQIYDEPNYRGYEVMLDVFPDVFAYGILLVPKSIKPGERRPVVVCQHGLEGRPTDVADPKTDSKYYHRYACRLADEGFVTYAPQNPYIGEDKFRTLQRKANPLKKSLFSIIVPQHQATVDWLASLDFVDPARIAFYGLSYGGKTAMRVPALVEKYCLSICSADFNEWIWKNVSNRSRYSYLGTGEYEMVEFDLGNTFNYAEMAALIAPRPFMVERGHHDGVAPDEWVAYEYAKVRYQYAQLKIPERTTIEFFDGPHTIHGVGTFQFLREHLNWPGGK